MTGSEPLWRAELTDSALRQDLDSRHPERLRLRASDVGGLVDAFEVVDAMWEPTLARARTLSASQLQQRVGCEYSFVETLRHLLFAWDAWLPRLVLRAPEGFHAWAIPPENAPGERLGGSDGGLGVLWSAEDGWSFLDSPPELEPVLKERAERFADVRSFLADATPEDLDAGVPGPPWSAPLEVSVLYCFRVVLNEEWWHHQFATRDLDVVAQV